MATAKKQTKVERALVAPAKAPAAPVITLPIPEHIHQVSLVSQRHMPSDLRNALQGRLGCLYTMEDGCVTAADGRMLRLAIADRTLEVYEQ